MIGLRMDGCLPFIPLLGLTFLGLREVRTLYQIMLEKAVWGIKDRFQEPTARMIPDGNAEI